MNRIGLSWADYGVILCYFAGMVGIGYACSRHRKDAADYLLGGRKMSSFPIAISMLMSVFSTYSLVMGPGEIYNHGMGWGIVGWFLPYIGIVSILIFTRFFFKISAFTPFEYLTYRYDKWVRLLAAFGNCCSQILYAGMVLLTSSKIFEAAAGWPCWATILLVGGVSILSPSQFLMAGESSQMPNGNAYGVTSANRALCFEMHMTTADKTPVWFHHDGRANAVLADGHVASQSPGEFSADVKTRVASNKYWVRYIAHDGTVANFPINQ